MISINNLSYLIGGRALFENASLHIKPKDKIGLIGLNGRGKSTLLRMINAEFPPTEGDISKANGMTLIVRGGLLEKDESLVLLFSDTNNRASTVTVNGPSNSIEHFIPPTNLANLTLGSGKLYLVKKKDEVVEEKRSKTISSIEFYSKTIDVEIKE